MHKLEYLECLNLRINNKLEFKEKIEINCVP